jgi:fatty acid desaturase
VYSQVIPWPVLIKLYLVFFFWIGVNQLRTLAAHRYAGDGDPLNYCEQLLDTNTFPNGGVMPELWAPLGMRYHALHHLVPSLPYHAMGEAHRRLMSSLPADSPYHRTVQSGLWAVVLTMVTHRLPRRGDAAAPPDSTDAQPFGAAAQGLFTGRL